MADFPAEKGRKRIEKMKYPKILYKKEDGYRKIEIRHRNKTDGDESKPFAHYIGPSSRYVLVESVKQEDGRYHIVRKYGFPHLKEAKESAEYLMVRDKKIAMSTRYDG